MLPILNDTRPQGALELPLRFVPSTGAERLAATYTLWNLLDRTMFVRGSTDYPGSSPFGYMRPVQLDAYVRFAQLPYVRTYCEVGVNGGHGTAAILLANPSLIAHSWDLGRHSYATDVYTILSNYFGKRFVLHRGDSRAEIPRFVNSSFSHDVKCDLILVDGDHHSTTAYADIINLQPLAACQAWLLVDDSWPAIGGAGHAVQAAAATGVVDIKVQFKFNTSNTLENPCIRNKAGRYTVCPPRWGFSVARYHMVDGCRP